MLVPQAIRWADDCLKLLAQTKLPNQIEEIECTDAERVIEAIKTLDVRGAPAIGIAAAYGLYLGIRELPENNGFDDFYSDLEKCAQKIAQARPTAVNLFWALDRMKTKARENRKKPIREIKKILLKEAMNIHKEDRLRCERIGKYGNNVIKDNNSILTICNAGALATGGIGTALGIIYTAKKEGKKIKVYSCETRPLLQGARLTCWELLSAGIDTILICDSMAGTLMQQGKIDLVIAGADRIASNGDTANKIGTYTLAVLAKYHNIPFYIAAPTSTLDLTIQDGSQIPIEERSPQEVRELFGEGITPKEVKVYNPAFDVTPAEYITAIITDSGIFYPPFRESLRRFK